MKKKLVFVDAETDGLYGGFLTVAMKVTDENGQEIDRAYYGIKRENMQVTEKWVQDHVVPILGEYEPCEDEEELLEKAWEFWMKHRENAYAVADVPYPVECRLFEKCVGKDLKKRAFLAPFPLLDLSSMLWAKGFDPLTERMSVTQGEIQGEKHNAAVDVEISSSIVQKILKENKR